MMNVPSAKLAGTEAVLTPVHMIVHAVPLQNAQWTITGLFANALLALQETHTTNVCQVRQIEHLNAMAVPDLYFFNEF